MHNFFEIDIEELVTNGGWEVVAELGALSAVVRGSFFVVLGRVDSHLRNIWE